jgi:transposase
MKKRSTVWTVGMDLGDKSNTVCFLREDGEAVEKLTIANNVRGINRFFDRFADPAQVKVAMESGTHSPWISHLLGNRGFEVLVGNARKLRAIWRSDQKNDWRDAEMLARIGRFDPKLLHPIRHRGKSAQADLAVIRARDALVRCRTRLINCARGLVKSQGHRLPSCSAECFPSRAADHLPTELQPALKPLLSQVASLNAKIRQYDRCIEKLCEHGYGEAQALCQIAGVGALTALAFVLTVEDPDRFKRTRSIGPFFGLTPKRDQSGMTDKQLPISKAGNEYMRRLLTQSANYILGPFGPPCDLRRFGERIAARGGKAGKRRAVTAVARKLAVLMLHLWKTNEAYEPFHHPWRGTAQKPAEVA